MFFGDSQTAPFAGMLADLAVDIFLSEPPGAGDLKAGERAEETSLPIRPESRWKIRGNLIQFNSTEFCSRSTRLGNCPQIFNVANILTLRCTIVVHTRLAGHMARVQAALAGNNGTQILTMGQLAARLAGGLLRPIDPDDLKIAVRESLANVQLGELEPIKDLPGMVRAAAGTLEKVWSAGIDLSRRTHPRLAALHQLEQEVLRRLPACIKRPQDLVERAGARIRFAKPVLGPIEIHGHSEMSPCWRPLLHALSEVVPVTGIAGSRHVPEWLHSMRVEIRTEPPSDAESILYSCAHPHHEVIEAFRWVRGLLCAGMARPEEIAIAAASPADFDDQVLAISRDCNIPVHFVHGTKAVASRDGQLAAALAEVLVKGVSQEKVRRLLGMLPLHTPALRDLPPIWTRILPSDAPLTTVERWQQVFAPTPAGDWPNGTDGSATVLDIVGLLAKGPAIAAEAGETLLSGTARALWRRALQDGPAEALPVTLTRLRSDDGLEPATHVIFASAMALASAPRPMCGCSRSTPAAGLGASLKIASSPITSCRSTSSIRCRSPTPTGGILPPSPQRQSR